jgi:uncharacterized protein YjiS (DUF1127 family)
MEFDMSAASEVKDANVFLPMEKQGAAMAVRRLRHNVSTLAAFFWLGVLHWHQKRETRRSLRNLTDGELFDIGLTRSEARKEAGKSFFWD